MVVRPAVIVDVETTSLTPDYQAGSGVIWELAMIWREDGAEHLWRMKPDLAVADASALSVGQFYKRTEGMDWEQPRYRACDLAQPGPAQHGPEWSSAPAVAALVARLLDGATFIAANPAFDTAFLAAFLRHYGQAPTWHYRLRDIGSLAAGFLARGFKPVLASEGLVPRPPALDASTDDYARALGVDPDGFERHSALGDCRLVAAMLDVIAGGDL